MSVSFEDVRRVGDALRVDWGVVSPDTFRRALEVELEHRDVTRGDLELTGRIALAHLREYPDYYDRLAPMEQAASEYWARRSKPSPTLGGAVTARALACAALLVLALVVVLAVVLSRPGRLVAQSGEPTTSGWPGSRWAYEGAARHQAPWR